MVLRDILVWWYTTGLRQRATAAGEQLDGVVDYFSIGLLFRTLFSPFRQISAGQVDGSFEVQMRALFDRCVSRAIGAAARLVIICIGAVWLVCAVAVAALTLVLWTALPILPFIGFGLFVMGWMPWNP